MLKELMTFNISANPTRLDGQAGALHQPDAAAACPPPMTDALASARNRLDSPLSNRDGPRHTEMNLLPFDKLTPYRARVFVPEKTDLGDWPQIAALFDLLEARAPRCKTAAQFQRWLLDGGELSAALEEEGSLATSP